MRPPKRLDRRSLLKVTGAAGLAALVAGCGGPDEEPEEVDDPEEEEEEPGDDPEDEEENGDADAEAWADVDEIVLEGRTEAWEGVEPEEIAGEENPTLVLTPGEEYTITWENADGDGHNIAIRDEDGQVIDDYSTDIMDEEGETQDLEFEATEEMAEYVCEPHEGTMLGEIEIAENGEDGEEEEEEAGDEEEPGDDEEEQDVEENDDDV